MKIWGFVRLLFWRLVSALAVTGIAVAAMYATGSYITTFSIFFIIPGGVLILFGLITYLSSAGESTLLVFFEKQREKQREKHKNFINSLRYRRLVALLTSALGAFLLGFGFISYYGLQI